MTMSYDNDRQQETWECPHCGRDIWEGNYDVTETYEEDNYYITEVTCECGCECRFYQPIDQYPNYVQYDLPPEEEHDEEEEEEEEEDEVTSEINDVHRRIHSLQEDIASQRELRDVYISLVNTEYPAQMGRRMPKLALERWREKRKQEIHLEHQEIIDMKVIEIEELQHQLTELEKAEAEKNIRNAEPAFAEGIRQFHNTATSKAEIWRNLQ